MKKIIFSMVLITGLISFNSFAEIDDEVDNVIPVQPNTTFVLNGQQFDSGPSGLTIRICPGNGEKCSITFDVNGHKMVYTGSKSKGGPDFDIQY